MKLIKFFSKIDFINLFLKILKSFLNILNRVLNHFFLK